MQFHVETIGAGHPHIALVGCLHGDEPIGQYVIEYAKRELAPIRGTLTCVLAHPEALERGVRCIETDLNRSFPGNPHGSVEEQIAHALLPTLLECDVVIDIHSTRSRMNELVIVTSLRKSITTVLAGTPIERVAYIPHETFGAGSLIDAVPTGISIDYGGTAEARSVHACEDVRQLLVNLGALDGTKTAHSHKQLYSIFDVYRVSEDFVPNDNLNEFQKITKGDVIGTNGGHELRASHTFFPLFLGKGRYDGTLSLMATQEEVEF